MWAGIITVGFPPLFGGGLVQTRARIVATDIDGEPLSVADPSTTLFTRFLSPLTDGPETRNKISINAVVPDIATPPPYTPTPPQQHPKPGLGGGGIGGIGTRLTGYKPWRLILPDGVPALQASFGSFGDFRGLKLKICNADSKDKADKTGADNPIAAKAEEQRAEAIAEGVPASHAKNKVVSTGTQGAQALDATTNTSVPGGSTTNSSIGSVLMNGFSFDKPIEIFDGFTIQHVELAMVGFKDLAAAHSAFLGVLGALNAVSNPPFSAQCLQGAVAYLSEHGYDILKCVAYEYISPSAIYDKLPLGGRFRGYATGLIGRAEECLIGSPPDGCNALEIGAKALGLGDVYANLNSLEQNLSKFPQDLRSIQILAANASTKGSITISENGLLVQAATIPTAIFPDSALVSAAAILASVLDTKDGNGSATLEQQLGQDTPIRRAALGAGKKVFQKIIGPNTKIPGFSNVKIPSVPFLGNLVSDLASGGFKAGQDVAAEDIMSMICEPSVLTITFPTDQYVVGFNSDHAIVHVEGHVSDYLPQFVRIEAQADNGPIVETVLDLVTLTSDPPDGATGNAKFSIDVPLPHGGAHQVKVRAFNAGDHMVESAFTCYVVGSQFPQEGTVGRGITSFRWLAKNGSSLAADGVGRVSYLTTEPGATPTQAFSVSPSFAGADLTLLYPDGSVNNDLVFVDPDTGDIITDIPSSGRFDVRLISNYAGRTFVGIAGNAEAKGLTEWRQEFRASGDVPAVGGFLDPDHQIIATAVPVGGPIFRLMHFWDVHRQRLTGRYTIRTRLTDAFLPTQASRVATDFTKGTFADEATFGNALLSFGNLRVLDQATFTLGTPIDPSLTVPTIAIDAYARAELRFEGGALSSTMTTYVNIFPVRAPPAVPLLDPILHPVGPKYEIYASPLTDNRFRLTATDFDSGADARFTVHYTTAEVSGYGIPAAIVEENLGFYRESASGTRVLLETQRPLGTFTLYVATGYLDGAYVILPSNSAPRVRALAASPLQFAPEDPSLERPEAEFFLSVATAASPTVFVSAEIRDKAGVTVRHLVSNRRIFLALDMVGEEGPFIAPEGADPRVVQAAALGAQKTYHYLTAGAPSIGSWDGKDDNGTLVPSGVYRIFVRVVDGVGNESSASASVVKDRLAPVISQVAGKTPAGLTLSAVVDGNAVSIRGTAANLMSWQGYRVGVRAASGGSSTSPWVGLSASDLSATGWTFLRTPEATRRTLDGDVTQGELQVTDGVLATWPIASFANGPYDLGLFVLGFAGDTTSATTVLDAALVSGIAIDSPPGLRRLFASPNPFRDATTLEVSGFGSATTIDFVAVDLNSPSMTLTVTGFRVGDSPVFRGVLNLGTSGSPRPFGLIATDPSSAVSPAFGTALYVPDNSLIVAAVGADLDADGIIAITGTAKVDQPDVLSDWVLEAIPAGGVSRLLGRSSLRAENELLTSIDAAALGGAASVTFRLTVHDVAGNTQFDEATIAIPFIPVLTVFPAVLSPNGDGISDTLFIATSFSRAATSASLGIFPKAGGSAVKTFSVSATTTLQSFTWQGTGSTSDDGEYLVRLVADSVVREAPLLLAQAASATTILISTSTMSAVPRAWFDLYASGDGRYDIPFSFTWTAKKAGTEQSLVYSDGVHCDTATASAGGNTSGNNSFEFPVNVVFRDHLRGHPFIMARFSDDITSCGGTANYTVGAILKDSSNQQVASCSADPLENACGLPICEIDFPFPDAARPLGTYHFAFGVTFSGCNARDCFATATGCATRVNPTSAVTVNNPVEGFMSPALGIAYAHRRYVKPFELRFDPVRVDHFDAPDANPGHSHEVVPQEGSISSITFGGAPAGDIGLAATGNLVALEGFAPPTEATDQNAYSNLMIQNGILSDPYSPGANSLGAHPWGSQSRILNSTATIGLRYQSRWTLTMTAYERFAVTDLNTNLAAFTKGVLEPEPLRVRPSQGVGVVPVVTGAFNAGARMRIADESGATVTEYLVGSGAFVAWLEGSATYHVSVIPAGSASVALRVFQGKGDVESLRAFRPLAVVDDPKTENEATSSEKVTINLPQFAAWSVRFRGGGTLAIGDDSVKFSHTGSGFREVSAGSFDLLSLHGTGRAHLRINQTGAIYTLASSGVSATLLTGWTGGDKDATLSATLSTDGVVVETNGQIPQLLVRTAGGQGETFIGIKPSPADWAIRLRGPGSATVFWTPPDDNNYQPSTGAMNIYRARSGPGGHSAIEFTTSTTQRVPVLAHRSDCSGGAGGQLSSSVFVEVELPGGEYVPVAVGSLDLCDYEVSAAGNSDVEFLAQRGRRYRLTAVNATATVFVLLGQPPRFEATRRIVVSGTASVDPATHAGATGVVFAPTPLIPGGEIVRIDIIGLSDDHDRMTVAVSSTVGFGASFIGTISASLFETDLPWSVVDARVRENLVRFPGLAPSRHNMFQRLAISGDPAAEAIPKADFTPHTSAWSVQPSAFYPDSTEPDPDVEIITASTSSSALAGSDPNVASDGFMTGDTYSQMTADHVSARLVPPTDVPYAARSFLKVPGRVPAGSRYVVEVGASDGFHKVVKDASLQPTPAVLGYADLTGRVGDHEVTVTNAGPAGITQQVVRLDVGHAVGSTVVEIQNPGGVAFDAYEAASLLVPAGGFLPGVRKSMFLRHLRPSEIPLLARTGLIAGLVYDLHVASNGVVDRLKPDDFVKTARGSVRRPAIMTVNYRESQLPNGIDESNMNLFRISGDGERLEAQPALIDTVANVIVTEVTRSSVFQVVADDAPPSIQVTAAPDPTGQGPVTILVRSSKTLSGPPEVTIATPGIPGPLPVGSLVQEVRPMLEGQVADVLGGFTLTSSGQAPERRDYVVIRSFPGAPTADYAAVISSGGYTFVWAGATITIDSTAYRIGAYELVPKGAGTEVAVRLSPVGTTWFVHPDAGLLVQGTPNWSVSLDSGITGVAPLLRAGSVVRVAGQDVPRDVVVLREYEPGQPILLPPAGFWAGKTLTIGGTPFTISSLELEGGSATGGRAMARLAGAPDVVAAGVRSGLPWVLLVPVPRWTATYTVTGNDDSGTATLFAEGTDLAGRTGAGRGVFTIRQDLPPVTLRATPRVSRAGSEIVATVQAGRQASSIVLTAQFNGQPTAEILVAEPQVTEGTGVGTGTWVARRLVKSTDANGSVILNVTIGAEDGFVATATASVFIDTVAPAVSVGVVPGRTGAGLATVNVGTNEPSRVAVTVFESSGKAATLEMTQPNPLVPTAFTGFYAVAPGATAEGLAQAVAVAVDEAGNAGLGTGTFTVDLTPPAAPTGLAGTRSGANASLAWNANAESDLAGFRVRREGVLLTSPLMPWPAGFAASYVDTAVPPGALRFTYQVTAVDTAGNESAPASVTVNFDLTAPVTTLVAGPPHFGASPAVTSTAFEPYAGQLPLFLGPSATLIFSAVDAGTGVQLTLARLSASSLLAPVTGPVVAGTLPVQDGQAVISFLSTDVGGNDELLKTATVYVDTLSPPTFLSLAGPSFTGTAVGLGIPVSVPAAPLTEAEVSATLAAFGITLEPGTAITATQLDGIRAALAGLGVFNIPVSSGISGTGLLEAILAGSQALPFGTFVGPQTFIILSATDSGSGVTPGSISYALYSGTALHDPVAYAGPFTLAGKSEGPWGVAHTASDRVENRRPVSLSGGFSRFLILDATAPGETTVTLDPEPMGGVLDDDTVISFTASDSGAIRSGVDRVEWRLDSATSWNSVRTGEPFNLGAYAAGSRVLRWRAVDRAGNAEPERAFGPFTLLTQIRFVVDASATQVAGTAFTVTVTASNVADRIVTEYTGTVTLTSTDPLAIRPAPIVAGALHAGVIPFSLVILYQTGPAKLLAYDAAGFSGTRFVTVIPAAPFNLTTRPADNQVALQWSYPVLPGQSVAGFRLSRATRAAGPFGLLASIPGAATTTYTDLTALNRVLYYYRLTAFDTGALESRPSNLAWAEPFGIPTTPGSLVATGVEAGVSLAWTPSQPGTQPVAGYDVLRRTGSEPLIRIARLDDPLAARYLDDTAAEAGTFTYVLQARDTATRYSLPSNEAAATALPERHWRHVQREVTHRGNLNENFALPTQKKWGTTAGTFRGVAIEGRRVFEAEGHLLRAIDRGSGSLLWTLSAPGSWPGVAINQPAVAGGTVYFTNGSALYAVTAAGNPVTREATILWTVTITPATPGATPALLIAVPRIGPTVAGGIVYLGMAGHAYAFDAANGSRVWSVTLPGAATTRVLPPAVAGATVYFVTQAGAVFGFDRAGYDAAGATPATPGQRTLSGVSVVGTPTASGDRLFVTGTNRVTALSTTALSTAWTYPLVSPTFAGDAAIAGGTVFVVSTNGRLHAVRESTGTPLWVFDPLPLVAGAKAMNSYSSPVVVGAHVFYTANFQFTGSKIEDGRLLAVDITGPTPSLAYLGPDNLGQTNQSPAVAFETAVLGNAAYGGLEANSLRLEVPALVVSGRSFTLHVSAVTAAGSVDTSINGQVILSSDDTGAVLPATITLVNGEAFVTVTLVHTGNVTLDASLRLISGITGSLIVPVRPTTGQVTSLLVSAPALVPPGTPFSITVTGLDASGGTVASYRGTVQFTSTDLAATLPAAYAFVSADAGTHVFEATLATAGLQTIVATDLSGAFNVSASVEINVQEIHESSETVVYLNESFHDLDFFGSDVGWLVGMKSDITPIVRRFDGMGWPEEAVPLASDCAQLMGMGVSLSTSVSGVLTIRAHDSCSTAFAAGYHHLLSGTSWGTAQPIADGFGPGGTAITMLSATQGWEYLNKASGLGSGRIFSSDGVNSVERFDPQSNPVTRFRFVRGHPEFGWAVGGPTGLLNYSAGSWGAVPSPIPDDLNIGRGVFDLWMNSPTDTWAVGINSVYHHDGTAWSQVSIPLMGFTTLHAVHFWDQDNGVITGIDAGGFVAMFYVNGTWFRMLAEHLPFGVVIPDAVRMVGPGEAWVMTRVRISGVQHAATVHLRFAFGDGGMSIAAQSVESPRPTRQVSGRK